MKKNVVAIVTALSVLASGFCPTAVGAEDLYSSIQSGADEKTGKVSIDGPQTYHAVWRSGQHSAEVELKNSAETEIQYEVLSGEAEVTGNYLFISASGFVYLKATAKDDVDAGGNVLRKGETKIILVSVDNVMLTDTVPDQTSEYTGNVIEYKEKIRNVTVDSIEYAKMNEDSPIWLASPKEIGKYFVKINGKTSSGISITRYSTLDIVPRKFTVKPEVLPKEYDGKLDVQVSNKIVACNGEKFVMDGIKVTCPKFYSTSENYGKHKLYVVGEYKVKVSKPQCYEFVYPDLSGLTVNIGKSKLTIYADSKTMYQGEKVPELTYSLSSDEILSSKPTLLTNVTSKTKPGTYRIKCTGGSSKNFEIQNEDGWLTVLKRPKKPDTSKEETTDDSDEPMEQPETTETQQTENNQQYNDTTYQVENNQTNQSNIDLNQAIRESTTNEIHNIYAEEEYDFREYEASNNVTFEGIMSGISVSENIISVDKVLTATGKISTKGTNYQIMYGSSGWTEMLDLVTLTAMPQEVIQLKTGESSKVYNIPNIDIKIREIHHKDAIASLQITEMIVDQEKPEITVDQVAYSSISTDVSDVYRTTQALTLQVNTLFGIAGQGSVSYKLISAGDTASIDSEGWSLVTNSKITVNQDFKGSIAVRAIDVLGNYSIIYTQPLEIDAAAPTIEGVKPGQTVNGSVTARIHDNSGISSISLDGVNQEIPSSTDAELQISDSGTHTIVAVDINGNKASTTFRIESVGFAEQISEAVKALLSKFKDK